MKLCKLLIIPAKAYPDEQENFVQQLLNPHLEEAKKGQRAVFFIYAAHFVLSPFFAFLCASSLIFISAPARRSRFNVLGALNAITHELIFVCNYTYINAESVCALLKKIAHPYLPLPLPLILHHPPYPTSLFVQPLPLSLHIPLLYLPPYSPHLHLIPLLSNFSTKIFLLHILLSFSTL